MWPTRRENSPLPLTSDAHSGEWNDNVLRISVRDCVSSWISRVTCTQGEVQKIVCGEYQVSVMVPAANNWKWPVIPEIFYTADKLAKRLKPPFVVNNRGRFGFLDL